MTIYLIEYARSSGETIFVTGLEGFKRSDAENERQQRELELRRAGSDHEIVLLEAANDRALKHTHGRYFADLKEIARAASI